MTLEGGGVRSGLFWLALMGCLTLVLGAVQFLRNRRKISRDEFLPDATICVAVVARNLAPGGCFVFYAAYLLLAP
jgi:putative membrane protein